jgi:hypothetical protein
MQAAQTLVYLNLLSNLQVKPQMGPINWNAVFQFATHKLNSI